MANAVDLSFLEAVEDAENERQAEIVRARLYHSGEHPTFLTDRMRQFLAVNDSTTKFNMNVTRGVVEAVTERLIVSTVTSLDKALAEWAWLTWQANKMSARQFDVYEQAVRDGECFVIVDWDDANARARWTPHPRYVSVDNDGDGFGCIMVYPDNDLNQPPRYAVKIWTEQVRDEKDEITYLQRATLYYPERVERYYYASGWAPLTEPGKPWPQPWTDGAGEPLGIPVVHFQNTGLRCEAWDAIPLQDGVNKSLIDLLAAADATGFPIYKALGFVPTTDGKPLASDASNALTIEPGTLIGTTKSKAEADVDVIQPGNLTPLMELTQQLVMWLAVISNTPLSRFVSSKQVAAEGTLKQQSEPLIAKVEKKQELFADAWEACLDISRRLAITFGKQPLDPAADLEVAWKPIEKRAQADLNEEWKAKRESGVPQEQLWSEMGYTREQIETMKAMPETMARMALMQTGLGGANG